MRSRPLAFSTRVVRTASALLVVLVGVSRAQQVQWFQSPINGHWYGAEYSPRTWTDSESLSVGMGGHLATIRSQAEQDWMQNTFGFANGTPGGLWIGFSDAPAESNWTWASGEVPAYSNWAPAEPNGGTNENYCQVYPIGSLSPWQWNDAPNNALNPNARPICETQIKPARSWSWPTTRATGLHPKYGCVADFNGDGNLDYASPDYDSGQISVFFGDGHGGFSGPDIVRGAIHPVSVAAFDINGDQLPDIIATDAGDSTQYAMNGSGHFYGTLNLIGTWGSNAHGVSSGDLDADGFPDLVVVSTAPASKISVVFRDPGPGGGFANAYEFSSPLPDNYQAAIVDYDLDGHTDLIIAGGEVALLHGSGTGPFSSIFTPAGTLGTGLAMQVATGDLDGDGDPDLVVPRANLDVLEVWKNNGAGSFQLAQTLVAPGMPHGCSLADVDGDLDLDVVVPHPTANTVCVYLNDGTGNLALDHTLAGLTNSPWLACKDFNNDGQPDILCSLTNDGFAVTLNQFTFDCDHNGIEDTIEIQAGLAPDCNLDGIPDSCEVLAGTVGDCNANSIPDVCDIATGLSQDCNANGVPDECDLATLDCNSNGLIDTCEIAADPSLDLDNNGTLDRCQNPGTPYCFGDGSGNPCPCDPGQAGSPGHGCANRTGDGAILSASGSASVTGDSVQLHAATLPNPTSVLFLQGTIKQNGGLGGIVGDGLLCVNGSGGNLIRLGWHAGQSGSADYGYGIGSDPLVSVRGQVPAIGSTRFYQVLYRDNASFCAPTKYNFSNGLAIVWTP